MALQSAPQASNHDGDLAARLLCGIYDAMNRPDLSRMVRDGAADDFPEIRAVAQILAGEITRLDRYEEALAQYADPGFWEDWQPGGALAHHDQGEMARNVLSGRPAFFHRD